MTDQQLLKLTKELMMEINQECFHNQLSINMPITLINSAKLAASVYVTKRTPHSIVRLSVSRCYNWNLVQLRNVIAHEMIHIYETQILKIMPSHGRKFQLAMAVINQDPKYCVTLKHSMISTKILTKKHAFKIAS